jgi:ComB9 competence protein
MTRIAGGGGSPLRIVILALATVAFSSLSWISPAGAQTPFGAQARQVPPTPPGKPPAPQAVPARTTQPVPQSVAPTVQVEAPSVPVPASVIKQAESQLNGQFPTMARAGVGGQVQDAWNESAPREGVQSFRLCDDCVYKIRLREFMATTIILPEDAEVSTADLGDTAGFQVKVKAANMIAVRPASYGLDTNLNVYSRSGAVYPFYLRAESFNSKNVPDLVVKIIGREKPATIDGPAIGAPDAKDGAAGDKGRQGNEGAGEGAGKDADKAAAAVEALTNPKPPAGDFVKNVPFDPSKLHGWKGYKLWGEEALRPETVFRDEYFTYIQYGSKWNALELPSAYVVIDGIDELVNSRVQGTTFIVESVAPLITLKSGKQFLCVQYTGDGLLKRVP